MNPNGGSNKLKHGELQVKDVQSIHEESWEEDLMGGKTGGTTDGKDSVVDGRSGRKRFSSKKVVSYRNSIKCHGMKTRKDINSLSQVVEEIDKRNKRETSVKGRGNLDDEITKSGSWNFTNEVAKVIETGIALGIDFDRGNLVSEEIEMREKEEEERFNIEI
ncbi:hypothetical protein LWI28_008949 [Acer negundo]|uniref:Uncharacterized protein n=1 Tax=Acer negundo TaxID=4023 RepID=A0AAD5P513_ACENE|nr:hypothetical protein LWI28_008949 [Acer negundo]